MSNDRKVLLLGCGYTLSRLALKLPRHATVVTRSSAAGCEEMQRFGFESIEFNFASKLNDQQRSLFSSVNVLLDSVPPRSPEHAEQTLQLVRQLKTYGLKRAVYLSTSGVFGRRDGSTVDEHTAPQPQSAPARARLDVEEAYQASGIPTTVLRLPAIYGPGRGIGLMLKAGTYRLIDAGEDYTNRIHVSDIVTLLERLLGSDASIPLVAVGDDAPSRSIDVVKFYVQKFGFTMPGSISLEEAQRTGHHTRLSNQRIVNHLMRQIIAGPLQFPSFREGAGQEFEADTQSTGR